MRKQELIDHPLWDDFSEKWHSFRVQFNVPEKAMAVAFWGYVEGYEKAVQIVAETTTCNRPSLKPNQN